MSGVKNRPLTPIFKKLFIMSDSKKRFFGVSFNYTYEIQNFKLHKIVLNQNWDITVLELPVYPNLYILANDIKNAIKPTLRSHLGPTKIVDVKIVAIWEMNEEDKNAFIKKPVVEIPDKGIIS